jgi:hypothetical protein
MTSVRDLRFAMEVGFKLIAYARSRPKFPRLKCTEPADRRKANPIVAGQVGVISLALVAAQFDTVRFVKVWSLSRRVLP